MALSSLADETIVYLWADGIYLKAGLEKEKAGQCLGPSSSQIAGRGQGMLREIVYAPSKEAAEAGRDAFLARFTKEHPKAADALNRDWKRRMVAFYDFPATHWKHLRTTNIIESPFASARLRTAAAKRFRNVEDTALEAAHGG